MKNIAQLCEDHPCVKIIKRNINLSIEPASVDQIDKIIQGLSHRKSTDLDNIVTKIVKTSANFIDSHLANIIKNDLFKDFFSISKCHQLDQFVRKMTEQTYKTIDLSTF